MKNVTFDEKRCENLLNDLHSELEQVRQASQRQEVLLLRISAQLQAEGRRAGADTKDGSEASYVSLGEASDVSLGEAPLPSSGCAAPEPVLQRSRRASLGSLASIPDRSAQPSRKASLGSLGSIPDRSAEGASAPPEGGDTSPAGQNIVNAMYTCTGDTDKELSMSDAARAMAEQIQPASSANSRLSQLAISTQVNDMNATSEADVLAGLDGLAWPPDSSSRLAYEGFSMMLLLYDALTVPYLICWNVLDVGFWALGNWCMRLFWTLDLGLSCCTGYWEDEVRLELRLPLAAMHYLKSFFLLDSSLVIWDWVSLLMPQLRIMRIMRLVRFFRQTRRVAMLMHKLKAMVIQREFHLLIDMSVIILSIFWIVHVLCCIWYLLGQDVEGSDTGETWLSVLPQSEAGPRYEYSTAMHWSLTQLTPGSMEVVPTNSKERIFNIVVLLIGLILGTSLIATITAMITQYRIQFEAAHKDFGMLQTYLLQSGADPGLCMAIKKQVLSKLKQKSNVKGHEVKHLALTSKSLQQALWCQVCTEHLEGHAFWSAWGRADIGCLVRFCNSALEARSHVSGDFVFEEGDSGKEMYIVAAGELAYLPGPSAVEDVPGFDQLHLRLRKGHWCAEIALWSKWRHLGTMQAAQISDTLCMSFSRWHSEINSFPESFAAMNDYGRAFMQSLRGNARSDLAHSLNYYECMSDMCHHFRLLMATPLFDELDDSSAGRSKLKLLLDPFRNLRIKRLPPQKLGKLRTEVLGGECDIGVVDGEVMRFVFVVALRITRHTVEDLGLQSVCRHNSGQVVDSLTNTRFLVRLAERKEEGTFRVSVQLPGTKRHDDESCEDAIERVITKSFFKLAATLKWSSSVGREVDTFKKDSPTYGIPTRYSRTLLMAWIGPCLETYTEKVPKVQLEPEADHEHRNLCPCFGRRASEESLTAQSEAIRVLTSQEQIVFLRNSNAEPSHDLYVWLLQEELEILSKDIVKPIVRKWVEEVCAAQKFIVSM